MTNGSETVTPVPSLRAQRSNPDHLGANRSGLLRRSAPRNDVWAFGQTAGTTGSSSSPYMYAGAWGYRTEGAAGLMHVGARYYDAQVGRFITRDTVTGGLPGPYGAGEGRWGPTIGVGAGWGIGHETSGKWGSLRAGLRRVVSWFRDLF
ncbi:MAG: hypothetical protein GX446_16320 [Chthonomonadales bacterium]|nr:hypothetical protein [Chthonomonadales bacterium]